MKLREYQSAAVDAVYDHLRTRDDNPVVVLPTGAGKSLVLGRIATDAVRLWKGRVLILAHVKELLQQNAEKIKSLCEGIPVGIYSAGLKRRDTETPILVAGIQSIYQRACDLDPFDLIIIDEAHMLSRKGDGMYRQFLKDCQVINPHTRVIGLTATPFRLDSGTICTPDHFLNHVCYEVGIKELIRDGYLSPLISKAGEQRADTLQLHIRGGEFIAGEAEALMNTESLVTSACREIVDRTATRQCCLIFAAGVAHAKAIVEAMRDGHGVKCGLVTGKTPVDERDQILSDFRTGKLKYLVNVSVLTTGFDAPNIDCVALLRPTMSPGLLLQMVGRGFRLHPGKENCLILDFGGNIERHGPIDQIKPVEKTSQQTTMSPAKTCENCQAIVACGYTQCPECGHPFPPPEREMHDATASDAGVLSGERVDTHYEVIDTVYRIHVKRDAPQEAPRCLRVDYMVGLNHWQSEYICVEHHGYARRKAEAWWNMRCGEPCPTSAEEALAMADSGMLARTESITIRRTAGEKYDRIIDHKLSQIPLNELEEVPF